MLTAITANTAISPSEIPSHCDRICLAALQDIEQERLEGYPVYLEGSAEPLGCYVEQELGLPYVTLATSNGTVDTWQATELYLSLSDITEVHL